MKKKYRVAQTRYLRSLVSGEIQYSIEIVSEIEANTADEALTIFSKGDFE